MLAVQAIKKGEYKAAEQQLTRIGSENQLGVLRLELQQVLGLEPGFELELYLQPTRLQSQP